MNNIVVHVDDLCFCKGLNSPVVLPYSDMVGLDGFEPSTSRLSGARSNHLSYAPLWLLVASSPSCSGGDDGNRTHDPLLAGQVLSQLSYTPIREVIGKSE